MSTRKDVSTDLPTDSQRAAGSTDGQPRHATSSVRGLELIIDYAIMEAAELKLPFVVYLLRLARSEIPVGATPLQLLPQ